MTATAARGHDAMEIAGYHATRAAMLGVTALIGPALAATLVSGVIYLISEGESSAPEWVDGVISFIVVAGFVWFLFFVVMSLSSMRRHYWYHRQILE